MVTTQIRHARCDDALEVLTRSGNCVFFTLTTADTVDYRVIRDRWRTFRHDFAREIRKLYGANIEYIMNYEKHPGYLMKECYDIDGYPYIVRGDNISHGWHIHGVFNAYLPIDIFRRMAQSAGFGRVHLERCTSARVADYLSKHALKAYRGLSRKDRALYQDEGRMRLVNTSRGLPALHCYAYDSGYLQKVRNLFNACRENYLELRANGINVKGDFRQLYRQCEISVLLGHDTMTAYYDLIARLKKSEKKSLFPIDNTSENML